MFRQVAAVPAYSATVPEMNRRGAMLMMGLGMAAVATPIRSAHAQPPTAETGPQMLWQDEFNGPAGSPPDPAKWFIVPAWDGMGWDGMGREGKGREGKGMEWNGMNE